MSQATTVLCGVVSAETSAAPPRDRKSHLHNINKEPLSRTPRRTRVVVSDPSRQRQCQRDIGRSVFSDLFQGGGGAVLASKVDNPAGHGSLLFPLPRDHAPPHPFREPRTFLLAFCPGQCWARIDVWVHFF